MSNFLFFSLPIIILLIILVRYFGKASLSPTKRLNLVTLFTIFVYRSVTWIYMAFGGNFGYKDTLHIEFLDHSWLGIAIVVATLLFWPKKKADQYRITILGLGAGMIIDEISELIMIFLGIKFPVNFRDSFPDFLLIMLVYFSFAGIASYKRNLTRNRIKATTRSK